VREQAGRFGSHGECFPRRNVLSIVEGWDFSFWSSSRVSEATRDLLLLLFSEPRASASGQVFIRAILCRDRNGAATLVKGVIPSERSESRNLHLALVWFPGAFLVAGLSGFEFRASNLFRI